MSRAEAKRRAKRNRELVTRMKLNGDVALIDASATHWPPRPIIEKDKEAIKALYREGKPTVKLEIVDNEE